LKARTRPRRPLSWYLIWTVIFGVLLAVVSGLIFSLPIWRTEKVKIEGSEYFPQEKILNIAKIPVGENMFLLDLDEIKSKFSKIVQIKEIKVKRQLPGTLVIKIKERKPFAIVMVGNLTTLIDDDGYIIAKQNIAASLYRSGIGKFPVIRGIKKEALEKGIRLNEEDRVFMANALISLKGFVDPSAIQLDMANKDDINIYIEDILKVKIGETKDIQKKIKTATAIIASLKDKLQKVKYIDVRIPDDPAVKFN
jgi:cell division protein FtsQ